MALSDRSKPLVLFIEDHEFIAGMYGTKLNMAGYDVKLAADGETGLRLYHDAQPDLVLLDLELPKISGLQILEEVKADPATKAIPVVVLTNSSKPADHEHCLALGAAAYYVKVDVEPAVLVAKVDELLRRGPNIS